MQRISHNTQHSQETDVRVPGGIRTRNHSMRAAADPRLKPRGHWDRPVLRVAFENQTMRCTLRNVY